MTLRFKFSIILYVLKFLPPAFSPIFKLSLIAAKFFEKISPDDCQALQSNAIFFNHHITSPPFGIISNSPRVSMCFRCQVRHHCEDVLVSQTLYFLLNFVWRLSAQKLTVDRCFHDRSKHSTTQNLTRPLQQLQTQLRDVTEVVMTSRQVMSAHLQLAANDWFDCAELEDAVRTKELTCVFVAEGRSMIFEVESNHSSLLLLIGPSNKTNQSTNVRS